MSPLNDTQQLLWHLITAPEGVRPALETSDGLRSDLARTVRGDERLDAAGRLDVYANMYFFRLLDALKEDFPAVLRVIGETPFHNLVTDYLLVHFPTHPSLRYAGKH